MARCFAVPDQTADTIAHLVVEQIVCRHGVTGQRAQIISHNHAPHLE